MAYSQEDIDLVKNRLLEVAKKVSPSWSDLDDEIFNAFWEDNKENPNAVLDFQINKTPEPEGQKKSGGSSPFAIENGVVTYNGKPVSEMTPEELRAGYGRVGSPGTPTMQFTAGSESGGEFTGYSYDPEYWEEYEETVGSGGDEGYATRRAIRLRPEYQQYYEYNPTGVGSENTAIPQVGYKPEIASRLVRDGENWAQVGIPRSFGGELEPIDPSRIIWDEELGYITPASNIRQPTGSVFTPGMLLLAGGMLGAIGMAGGFSGLGIGGAAAEGAATTSGFPAGAGIAGPSLETAGVATGALEGAGAATGAVGAGGAATGAGGGGLNLVTGLEPITLPATNLTAPTLASLPNVGGGILGGVGEWFSGLSPMAQRAIMSGLSTGASSIMAGRRQESAQDFARQQYERQQEDRRQEEERARQERERRGTPQQYTFNVTRRPGIIGGGMGG